VFLVPTGQSGSFRAAVVMLFAHAHIVFSKHAVDAVELLRVCEWFGLLQGCCKCEFLLRQISEPGSMYLVQRLEVCFGSWPAASVMHYDSSTSSSNTLTKQALQ
jgi:hypothetical protein